MAWASYYTQNGPKPTGSTVNYTINGKTAVITVTLS
jgi:hypothetical protein